MLIALGITNAPGRAAAAPASRETRQVFTDFAACAAKQNTKEAQAVVLSLIPNDEIIKKHPAVVTPSCMAPGGQLRMPGDYLRYGLAEALVRRELASGLPADIRLAARLEHFEVKEADYQPKPGKKVSTRELAELQKRKERALAFRALSIYGECVVRTDAAGALRLVLSKSVSAAETQAFTALQPALSECMTEGRTIELDRAALRGTIAMNLYRLARAPRVAAPASQ
jgi:hypothetical protein